MDPTLLNSLSSLFVNGEGQPTWAWVLVAAALSALVLWREHADRKRVGSIYPSVDDACIPDDTPAIRLGACRRERGPLIDQ